MKSIILTAGVMFLLAGCNDMRSAQQRREAMVNACINDAYTGHSPTECAQAAQMAIPEGTR